MSLCFLLEFQHCICPPPFLPQDFPLPFPLFIIHRFVSYFFAAVKSPKAMSKPGVTSWFNSNKFCIYLFLHWLGLLTILHSTRKKIFHCMAFLFCISFLKKEKKKGEIMWGKKQNSNTIWVQEDLVQNSFFFFSLGQGTWISNLRKLLLFFKNTHFGRKIS